jgi:hypothetical protein
MIMPINRLWVGKQNEIDAAFIDDVYLETRNVARTDHACQR